MSPSQERGGLEIQVLQGRWHSEGVRAAGPLNCLTPAELQPAGCAGGGMSHPPHHRHKGGQWGQALGSSEEGAGDLHVFLLWHLALAERTRSGASLLEVTPEVSPGGKFAACHLS